jgi:hypothetical protein
MTRMDAHCRIPEPGWAFRITALHTSDTETPWLTGTWHKAGSQPADPACALWLLLAEHAGGVDVALMADHEHTFGAFTSIAHHTGLGPGIWTSVLAPAIAAHPFATVVHHPKPHRAKDRAACALLAYLITSR